MIKADSSSTSSDSDTESPASPLTHERRGQRVLAVPAVRRIAMENKVLSLLPLLCKLYTTRSNSNNSVNDSDNVHISSSR